MDSEGQCRKIQAKQEGIVALTTSEALQITGKGESDMKAVLELRRRYQVLNAKLEVVREMGSS